MAIETIIGLLEQASELSAHGDKFLKGAAGIIDTLKNKTESTQPAGNEELRALVVALANEIADAKMENAALKAKLVELTEQAIKQKAASDEFARYELWQSERGTVVYRIKDEARGAEPLTYICPNCKEDGKKSILQGHEKWRKCPRCETEFPLANDALAVHSAPAKRRWSPHDI